MPDPPDRIALYRLYDADGGLLYIGISNDPDFRWKAHLYELRRGDWPKKAVRRSLEWYDSRALALAAEEKAIKAERPRYNGTHNYDVAPFDPSSWPLAERGRKVEHVAALMRSEIINCRWTVGQRLPPVRAIGAATGASQQVVSKASAELQRERLLVFEPGRGLFVSDGIPREPAQAEPEQPEPARWHLPRLPHDWPRRCGFPG